MLFTALKQLQNYRMYRKYVSKNNNEVFLRVTNHTGQAEKNLLGPAGIRTRDLRFTSPMLYQRSQPGQVDFSLLVRYGSSLGETPHYYSPPEFIVP